MPLWGEMRDPAETTANWRTFASGGPVTAGAHGAGPTVTVSLRVGSVSGRYAMPRCVRASLRGLSARLRAAVRLLRRRCPALGDVCGLGRPATPRRRARGRARGRGAAPHLGAAGHGARVGKRRRLRALGRWGHLRLPVADQAALVAGPVPAPDGRAAAVVGRLHGGC